MFRLIVVAWTSHRARIPSGPPVAAADDTRHSAAQLEAHAALHALHRAFVQSLNDATAPLIAAANAKQANEKVHGGTGWQTCFLCDNVSEDAAVFAENIWFFCSLAKFWC